MAEQRPLREILDEIEGRVATGIYPDIGSLERWNRELRSYLGAGVDEHTKEHILEKLRFVVMWLASSRVAYEDMRIAR